MDEAKEVARPKKDSLSQQEPTLLQASLVEALEPQVPVTAIFPFPLPLCLHFTSLHVKKIYPTFTSFQYYLFAFLIFFKTIKYILNIFLLPGYSETIVLRRILRGIAFAFALGFNFLKCFNTRQHSELLRTYGVPLKSTEEQLLSRWPLLGALRRANPVVDGKGGAILQPMGTKAAGNIDSQRIGQTVKASGTQPLHATLEYTHKEYTSEPLYKAHTESFRT